MYRRFYRNDELLSNVLLSFALLLLFGMLISWKLVGVDIFDAEMIVYIVFASLSFLLFVFFIVVFLIGSRKRIIDIEIDPKKREIRTFNSKFIYSYDDVRLYAYNKRHRQVRFLLKYNLLGFFVDEMQKKGQVISQEELDKIAEHAVIVEPKTLYNYHLLTILVISGFTVFYMILASTTGLLLFNTYIPTYYAISACLLLSVGLVVLNHWRMKRIYTPKEEQKDTD